MADCFYRADGATFISTELTRGPWDTGLQHGGPPSALLCRAFEEMAGAMRVVRVTVEIIRPIPIAPLSVRAEITRRGKKVTWLAGSIECGAKEVARATATAIRSTALDLPPHPRPGPSMAGPQAARSYSLPFFGAPIGYHTGMEMRLERGDWGKGPCAAWMRMLAPLVEGEQPSPLQRVVVAADAGNGVSITLPPRRFTVLNADLTVDLHRLPRGEWIGLDAVTVPEREGIGLAESRLHDSEGPIGRALQTLVVEDLGG